MDNVEEMDKFSEKYNFPKLNHEDLQLEINFFKNFCMSGASDALWIFTYPAAAAQQATGLRTWCTEKGRQSSWTTPPKQMY